MCEIIQTIQKTRIYQATLIILTLVDAVLLLYEFTGYASVAETEYIFTFDIGVAYVFLTDFIVGVFLASKRWQYTKDNWMNLLSGIPFNSTTFHVLRILRIIRAVRLIRATGALISLGQAGVLFSKMRRK